MKKPPIVKPLCSVLLILFFLLPQGDLRSQVNGCTDPAASNYNASAITNDGSCTYNAATFNPVVLVDSISNVLKEISGLRWAGGGLWGINDAGNQPAIYRLNTRSGAILQTVTLAGATNVDWEELAFDGTHFYVGDFGNNANGTRTDLKIYKFPISAIADYVSHRFDTIESELIEVIYFVYSDQPKPLIRSSLNSTEYDCEAMIVDSAKIHLFTKNWLKNISTHYVIESVFPGTYTALPVDTLATNYLVTSADKATEKNVLVLLGYQNSSLGSHFIHVLSGYSGGKFFNGNKRRIDLPDALIMGQSEGITFGSGNYAFICNENLNRTSGPLTVSVNQKLRSIYIPFVYVFTGDGDWNEAGNWSDGTVPAVPVINSNEVYINPALGQQCYFKGNLQVMEAGKIKVQPGKQLIIRRP